MASPQDLHCCAVPQDRPVLLACELWPGDRITRLPYASYVDAAEDVGVCGHERRPDCGSQVDAALAHCVGRSRCSLDKSTLGDPCPGLWKVLRVRWECWSDSNNTVPNVIRHEGLPPLPLQVENGLIVDRAGARVRFMGVNWPGAQNSHNVPDGLNRAPLRDIARLIRTLGFNLVRLPFSSEAVRSNPVVAQASVAANPRLIGFRALEVFDEVTAALQSEGLLVWLDHHMHESGWCCGADDCNGLWFNANHSADDWVAMWQSLARRYSTMPAVAVFGLKNEPRRVCRSSTCDISFANGSAGADGCVRPEWSSGPEHLQFRRAMEAAGRAVLEENPSALVSVSGLSFGADLRGAAAAPIRLPSRSLLYEAHDYPWFSPPTVRSTGLGQYGRFLDERWGFLMHERTAPVVLSEFGFEHSWEQNPETRQWQQLLTCYAHDGGPMRDHFGLDWVYWTLSGEWSSDTWWRRAGSTEPYGVLNHCWTGPASGSHYGAIQQFMRGPGGNGTQPGSLQLACSVVSSSRRSSVYCVMVMLLAFASIVASFGAWLPRSVISQRRNPANAVTRPKGSVMTALSSRVAVFLPVILVLLLGADVEPCRAYVLLCSSGA
eukprot:CAMPEP_0168383850 /NCGR_PEP_ID=MMETSP0228-20121227/14111_1 /TAXON_ID=133427 /ORGANISM="Protoceratium reticulatum, Strain CCCM 535 (=CCMP 1889)" /LENGTH=604 /DNA_ID=CAMNT_0008397005 /DNA_START=59 /DNA_END=1874 /DNA_ORIENTATION=-